MIIDIEKLLEKTPSEVSVTHIPHLYDSVIRVHPFYMKMTAKIISSCKQYSAKRKRILEIGAGTGTLTEIAVSALVHDEYVAIEPDKHMFSFLKEKLNNVENLRLMNTPIENFEEDKFNLIISSFVDHHIPFNKKEDYYKRISSLLVPQGIYIAGEEIIQHFRNAEERIAYLKTYHEYIIRKCLEEGHFLMAKIELHALKNGIEDFDEYKTSLKTYLQSIENAGFEIVKVENIGPEDHVMKDAGIYVVVSRKNII